MVLKRVEVNCYTELRAMAVLKVGTSHLDDFGIISTRDTDIFCLLLSPRKHSGEEDSLLTLLYSL